MLFTNKDDLSLIWLLLREGLQPSFVIRVSTPSNPRVTTSLSVASLWSISCAFDDVVGKHHSIPFSNVGATSSFEVCTMLPLKPNLYCVWIYAPLFLGNSSLTVEPYFAWKGPKTRIPGYCKLILLFLQKCNCLIMLVFFSHHFIIRLVASFKR